MDNRKLDDELLDEDLADFFNDEPSIERKEPNDKEIAKRNINELIDTFNVKKDSARASSIKDINELRDMISNIRENIKSFEAVYGEDVTEKIALLLKDEEEIERLMQEFMDYRMEMLNRINAVKDVADKYSIPKEVEKMFARFAAMHPELDTVYIYYSLSDMINKRKEMIEANESGSGSTEGKPVAISEDGQVVGLEGVATGLQVANIITDQDKQSYLEDFFTKVKIIEEKAGIVLDPEFIKFFTSDEYIKANDLTLPPLLQDENYDKLKDTWSLPVMVEDSREEETNLELYQAKDSINSLEKYYAQNYGNTQDNSVIETLKGLSEDVSEEKERIEKDIEFFKKEKMKERVEVAILASVAGYQSNKKIDTLANLLKEKITNRVNYMNDEKNLRDMRKENINDMTNKDNERNSSDYFEALQGVNTAINKRREQRASGQVKFTPKIILAKNELKKNEIHNDERSIDNQKLSMGGRQKVLTYVNKYNNNNNNAA